MAIIALDIGGTKIEGAVFDNKFNLLKSLRVPTMAKKGRTYVLKSIELVIAALLKNTTHKLTTIGISLPGFANDAGKIIFGGSSLSFLEGVFLKDRLEKKFSLPVRIENDANCFTLAESHFGVGKDVQFLIGVIWGSGLGAGLVYRHPNINRSIIFRGSLGGAMEFGQNKVLHPITNKLVHLESLVGGKYLVAAYKKQHGKILYPTVSDIYYSNESFAKKIIKQAILFLGKSLAKLVNTLNPDCIVIGGGVSHLPSAVYKDLLAVVKKEALPSHTKKLKIKPYSLRDDAGLLGAAYLAKNN